MKLETPNALKSPGKTLFKIIAFGIICFVLLYLSDIITCGFYSKSSLSGHLQFSIVVGLTWGLVIPIISQYGVFNWKLHKK